MKGESQGRETGEGTMQAVKTFPTPIDEKERLERHNAKPGCSLQTDTQAVTGSESRHVCVSATDLSALQEHEAVQVDGSMWSLFLT
eukprot:523625-Pelagomonas_calceolata.AAC.1